MQNKQGLIRTKTWALGAAVIFLAGCGQEALKPGRTKPQPTFSSQPTFSEPAPQKAPVKAARAGQFEPVQVPAFPSGFALPVPPPMPIPEWLAHFASTARLVVESPQVSTANAYEGSTRATPWYEIPLDPPLHVLSQSRPARLLVTLGGNVNWNGCSGGAVNYQIGFHYSVDGGRTTKIYKLPGLAVENGGTDFTLPVILDLPAGFTLDIIPKVRHQQVVPATGTCVTAYLLQGVMEIEELP